jgi:hypothetical protein
MPDFFFNYELKIKNYTARADLQSVREAAGIDTVANYLQD